MVSNLINNYIKDSLINGKVTRFGKNIVNVFVSQIVAPLSFGEKQDYYDSITNAIRIWNEYSPVKFQQINTPQGADIVINWGKVGIKLEGMCKFRSIVASEIKAITIDVGLPNPNSPKKITKETILHTILHELGHSLGLGHGVEADDVMYVPHQKTLNKPSENDLYVLNLLYKTPIGTSLCQINSA